MRTSRLATLVGPSLGMIVVATIVGHFFAPGVLRSETPMSVWVVPSLVRVGLADPPGSISAMPLSGARGEYVDAQVVVTAPSNTTLTDVNVTVTDLIGPNGAVIAKSNYNLYREHYVTFASGSLDYGPFATNRPLPPGTYPDPLIPFNDPETGAPLSGNGASLQAVPFEVTNGHNQPIWVDLFIPRAATTSPPGVYTGSIVVTSSQGEITVPVSLTVWNFELPLVPSERTLFFIFDNRRGVVKANQTALLRHKITPMRMWHPSFAASQMAEFGLTRTDLVYFGAATCDSMAPAPSVADIQSQAAQYPPGLSLDIYPADEVSGCAAIYPTLKEWARNAHAAGAKIVITMKPDPALYDDEGGTGTPAVDHWAMLPRQWPSRLTGIPGELWSYNDLEGDAYSPKWQIDFLPINYRIQAGFLNQMVGATGLLYWAVDFWPSEDTAWDNVLVGPHSGAYWPGEGILIYPGARVGTAEPAPSMRLKYLRDGIQDYEYVQLLRNKNQASFINSVIRPIAANWHNWTRDESALEAVRLQSGEQLDRLFRAN
jgi:glycosyl hydrolase family 123